MLEKIYRCSCQRKRNQAYGVHKQQEQIAIESERNQIVLEWPLIMLEQGKKQVIQNFREQTSSKSLATFVCFACAGEYNRKDRQELLFSEFELTLLNRPDLRMHKGNIVDRQYSFGISMENSGEHDNLDLLRDVMYDSQGLLVDSEEAGRPTGGYFCKSCCSAIRRNKTPSLALANHNFIGSIPPVLRDLSTCEEMMISQCRVKCFIMHLREETCDIPNAQRGMKGNVIIFLQRPSRVLDVLPPPMEDVVTPICVLFDGSSAPSVEWLRKHAKPLIVHREKVRSALLWLCQNNILYSGVSIDHERLDLLSEEDVLPVYIEILHETSEAELAQDMLTSRYDSVTLNENAVPAADIFQHVVVTDVDGNAPSHELRAAALRHVKEKVADLFKFRMV